MRSLLLVVVCSAFLVLDVTHAFADDTALRDALARMFEVGWKPSVAANTQVDAIYAEIKSSPDWRAHYGYALAKMRQWRYAEAVVAAKKAAEQPEAQIPARHMTSWLLTVQKKYSAALVELEALAAALPAGEALAAEQKEQRDELIRYLGRVYGYLSGPAANAVTDFERESRRRRIVKNLSEDEVKTFDSEARRVAEQFVSRLDERERVVEAARKEAEATRRKRLDELAELQTRLADELEQLARDRGAAQDEFNETAQRLEDNDAPLRDRYQSLDTEAAGIYRQQANVNFDIARIEEQLGFEEDPNVRTILLQDLSRLSSLSLSYDQELTRLESAAASVQSQRADIAAQQRQAENRFQAELQKSEGRRRDLEKQSQRADAEQKKMMKEIAAPRGRALERQAKAFSTYLSFPLDDEKQRLLKSFGS